MSTPTNIERARQIVTAASQLAWSLYVSGDLSTDQHGPISLALGVADMGIRAVEALVAERDAALADTAALREALNTAYALANTPERNQDDQWEARHAALLPMLSPDNHPGASLLAELQAARNVVATARLVIETWAGVGDVTPIDLDLSALAVALGDYNQAVKARSE